MSFDVSLILICYKTQDKSVARIQGTITGKLNNFFAFSYVKSEVNMYTKGFKVIFSWIIKKFTSFNGLMAFLELLINETF